MNPTPRRIEIGAGPGDTKTIVHRFGIPREFIGPIDAPEFSMREGYDGPMFWREVIEHDDGTETIGEWRERPVRRLKAVDT